MCVISTYIAAMIMHAEFLLPLPIYTAIMQQTPFTPHRYIATYWENQPRQGRGTSHSVTHLPSFDTWHPGKGKLGIEIKSWNLRILNSCRLDLSTYGLMGSMLNNSVSWLSMFAQASSAPCEKAPRARPHQTA